MNTARKSAVKFIGGTIVLALIVFAVLRLLFIDFAVVGHNGMAPTMEAGDTIISWRTTDFDIGDIAMCLNPRNSADFVMGRVAAKSGMTITRGHRGQLVIEGSTPDIDWQDDETFTDTIEGDTTVMRRGEEKLLNVYHAVYMRRNTAFRLRPVTVGQGRIFLLGDNRTHANQDSRFFGDVDPSTCRGVVFMRLSTPENSPNDIGNGWLDIIH